MTRDLMTKKDGALTVVKAQETAGLSTHIRIVLLSGEEIYLPTSGLILTVEKIGEDKKDD